MANESPGALDESLVWQFLAHLHAGRRQAAVALLEAYVRDQPAKTASTLWLVAALLAQNGQFAEAIPLYLEANRLNPAEPLIYFHLGLAYHGLNRRQESYRVWDELAKRFPGHPTNDFQAALRLIDDSRLLDAAALLDRAAGMFDEKSPLYADLAATRRILRQKQDAAKPLNNPRVSQDTFKP